MRKIDPAAFIQWSDHLDQLDAQIDSSTIFVVGFAHCLFTVATATRSMIAAIKQIKDTQERAEQEKTTTIFLYEIF